ncbi:MAG: radical SAM protein [Clostridiales bacterium]
MKNKNNYLNKRKYVELSLPVAPTCNMMCSFCTKNIECLCNVDEPKYIRRILTPRQAVKYAIENVTSNKNINTILINGPGEPLANLQTFEVLRRLNKFLPTYFYSISSNGLDLYDKIDLLAELNVNSILVSFNAIYNETISVLYSRIIKNNEIINDSIKIKEELMKGQIEGIKKCIDYGIKLKVRCMFFPGINDNDIISITSICKQLGVEDIEYISCYPSGKLKNIHIPTLKDLEDKKEEVSRLLKSLGEENF